MIVVVHWPPSRFRRGRTPRHNKRRVGPPAGHMPHATGSSNHALVVMPFDTLKGALTERHYCNWPH